jgi:tetratricopeptide (TPR) repeat protein
VTGFVGRQSVLDHIKNSFSTSGLSRIVVLRGLGGQGKTQIALQYCLQTKKEYTATLWVDATSEGSVQKAFAAISQELKPPDMSLQDNQRVRYVIDTLQEWPDPWLMVFDNYDDPEAFNNIQDYMPVSEQGRVLITSRHAASKELADGDDAIELLGLPKPDALTLLFKQSQVSETASTLEEAEKIIDRLGYHALAITQAGSYIRAQKINVKDFFAHYDEQRKAILEQTPQMTTYRKLMGNAEKETAMNVFTTWELSFVQLLGDDSLGPQCANVLTLFAFFDSKDISEELLIPFCEEKSQDLHTTSPGGRLKSFLDAEKKWHKTSFVTAIQKLADLSLVQSWWRDDDGFCHISIHPLVRDWIRIRKTVSECFDYSLVCADILAEFPRSRNNNWHYNISLSTRQAVLSHINAHESNQQFVPSIEDPSSKGALLSLYRAEIFLGQYLRHSGGYEESERLFRRIFDGRGKLLEPEHINTLNARSGLCAALTFQDKFEEAEIIYRSNLEIIKRRLGPEDPGTLTTLHNLGVNLQLQDKLDEAEKILRQVLEMRERISGKQHLDTLRSMAVLAGVLRDQEKYGEAESLYRQVLEGREKGLDPEHVDTLVSAVNLGILLRRRKRLDEALPLYQRAYAGFLKDYGKNHPYSLKLSREQAELLEEIEVGKAES